jgi:hypothetical protein
MAEGVGHALCIYSVMDGSCLLHDSMKGKVVPVLN